MGAQVLGQRGARPQHGHQVPGEHRGGGQPYGEVGQLVVEPFEPDEREVGVCSPRQQLEHRLLGDVPRLDHGQRGTCVDEATPGQGALRRLHPRHHAMLPTCYSSAGANGSCRGPTVT